MKLMFLLALVGFGAAIPLEQSPILVNSKLSISGYQGNSFDVPEYVAFQFSLAQKAGYTPAQVVAYLLEQGYPDYVAQYLGEQYAAGLSKPYFESPYEIFRYFYNQGISDNIREYINQQIAQVYQQDTNGQQYLNVPVPFSQYVVQQRYYFNQYEKIFSGAQYAYQQLQLVEQHVQNAIQIFSNAHHQQSEHQYIYLQLLQGLVVLKNAKEIYQTYQSYQENYIPYYVAQYYAQQAALVYKYLQQTYQYIEGKQIDLPQQFVQELLVAYETAQKVYLAYQPSFFSDVYQTTIDQPSGLNYGKTPSSSFYYNYGPYSSSYLYGSYGPYKQTYGYSGLSSYPQYGQYTSSYHNFGKFSPYTGSYGYQYGPYQQSQYGQYNQGSSYTWPYYSSSYTYNPYGEQYGFSSNYVQGSSYTPYEYGSYVPSTSKVWEGVQPYGIQYPLLGFKFGLSKTYPQIAAIGKSNYLFVLNNLKLYN